MARLASGRYRGDLANGQRVTLRCERQPGTGALLRLSADVRGPGNSVYSFVSEPGGAPDGPVEVPDGFLRVSAPTVSLTGRDAFPVTLDVAPAADGSAAIRLVARSGAVDGTIAFVDAMFRSLVLRVDVWPGVALREPVEDGSEVGRRIEAALAAAGIEATIRTGLQAAPAASARRIEFRDLHAWLGRTAPPGDAEDELFVSLLLGGRLGGSTGALTQGVMYELSGARARQGVAVFLDHKAFATSDDELWRRQVVFAVLHEIGHALNLPHAWLATPPGPSALSWMTYPDKYPGGVEPFWTAFAPGCFGEAEMPYIRHACHCDIVPGQSDFDKRAWQGFAEGGGSDLRVAPSDLQAELTIAPLKTQYVLGEPVFLRAEIRNTGTRRLSFVDALDPSDGFLSVVVTAPNGERRAFAPPARLCQSPRRRTLAPDARKAFDGILLSFSREGPVFEEPGPYAVEARFEGVEGVVLSAVTRLRILYPTRSEELFARALFSDPRLCRAIWLRHPLAEKEAWNRLMDDHADLVAAMSGSTTWSYLRFVAALGWLKPYREAPGEPDCRISRRKARAHLEAIDVTGLPSSVGRLRAALDRAKPPGT